MNKRNELRAKLQARHNQQQQQQQTRGGGGGGPMAASIPKAKRPAVVAAISATVPKKQKLEHKFHHKHHHLPQHVHQPPHHQQHHQLGASSSASCTSAFASSTTNNFEQQQRQQQQQQHQSLLLVREAAECAASALGDAVGDVVVEEWGAGSGIGVPLSTSTPRDESQLRNRMSMDSFEQRFGVGEDQAVRAPSGAAWLSSAADGRQIDDTIGEPSLDKVVQQLSNMKTTASTDLSAEAITRMITFVYDNVDQISADQSRLLCRSLRAHRLKGINGAEKLLLLLCNSRKQQQPDERDGNNGTPFSRPPPLAGAVVVDEVGQHRMATNGEGEGQQQVQQRQQAVQVGAKKGSAATGSSAATATTSILHKVSSTGASLLEHCHRFSTDKSAHELLELLVAGGKTAPDEQQMHFLVAELLDKRPDLLDVDASNFDDEVHALFSSRQPIARSLIAHQLALCSSASVIKKTVSVLLKCFNPNLTPALVVSFVAGVCAEEAKIRLMLNGEQCFVLALYVLEGIEHHYTPDMTETALASLESMRQFCAVFDTLLSRATPTTTSTRAAVTGATDSLPVGTAQARVVTVPPYSPASDLLDAFTRHYRAYVDKLWHTSNVSAFISSSSGTGQLRRRHCLNLLFRTVCRNFPVVPSKCLFLGMLAPRAGQQMPPHHVKRAQFDRLITGAIREIFELTSRAGAKGGPDVDLALDKAHQLVQHFRNSRDVQFSRYMPLLSTKVQNLVDSLAGCEVKNSPHCALLLLSLDLIIVALRNFDGTAAVGGGDNDYDYVDDGNNKNGTSVAQLQQQQPPLLHAVANALQSLLQFLKNRRNRQIQSLCERVCNAVVQLLKCCGGGDLARNESVRQMLRTNSVLLGELADWKALNLTDRAILKRTAKTAQFE